MPSSVCLFPQRASHHQRRFSISLSIHIPLSFVFAKFQIGLTNVATNQHASRTIPMFLTLYIFGFLYQLLLACDALRLEILFKLLVCVCSTWLYSCKLRYRWTKSTMRLVIFWPRMILRALFGRNLSRFLSPSLASSLSALSLCLWWPGNCMTNLPGQSISISSQICESRGGT